MGALTREVELVKQEFSREQECLKVDLQKALSTEVSYRDEVRNALIHYYAMVSEWIYATLEVGFGNYTKDNIDALVQARMKIASFYASAGVAKSKVTFLTDNKEIRLLAHDLYCAVLTFYHWTDTEFLKLQHNCENLKSIQDQFIRATAEPDQDKNVIKDVNARSEQLLGERKQLIDHYMANMNDQYKLVLPVENEFSTKVKTYLKT
ncbi:MAG: hypothetical protein KDD36_12875 [Flavobacteriales bacterium]|nr:hypothetical protein [Flavobacteriales bacterium]